MRAFDKAFQFTLANEGGFANVKEDKGGPTKYGITIGTLRQWRKVPVSANDVRHLTLDEAKSIYKAWYWDTLSLDMIKYDGVAMAMFDIGVVMGIDDPPVFAQKVCCQIGTKIPVDGHIGSRTIAAINEISPAAFIHAYAGLVGAKFKYLTVIRPKNLRFLKGWLNRTKRLLTLIDA